MIEKRTRFFLAVEGESERSFAKWLQILAERDLHIHLDVQLLYGGGFESMLSEAVRLYKKGISAKGRYEEAFLLVDSDRAQGGDWPVEKLRKEAASNKITVCFQNPRHEGVLLRMFPGKEHSFLDVVSTERQFRSKWPKYQKPVNAHMLGQRFTRDDLIRMAMVDDEMRTLLQALGLI